MSRLPALLAALLLTGCASTGPAAGTPPVMTDGAERAAFVTRLGDDTLAVERFAVGPDGAEATVALRAPRTTLVAYALDLGDDGALRDYEAVARQPLTGEVLGRQAAEPVGDSLRITTSEAGGETQTATVAGGRQKLLLEILGPNMRAVQITDDLAGFWRELYPSVRQELSRRYPKHEWR